MKKLLTVSLVLLFPAMAAAQSSTLFPSSSGSSSSSSGRSPSGGSMSSAGGGGSGSSMSSLQQSLGGGGQSGSGTGTSQFGTGELASPAFTQFGQAGAATLESGFVGANEAGTFVGVESATSTGQQAMQSNRQALSGLGDRGEGPNSQSQGRSTTGRSRIERLQPVTRIAFDYAALPATEVQTRIETRLLEGQFDIDGMGVSLDDQGVLTLTGVAASEDAGRLAEIFLGMEPGVRRIDNQVVVVQ